MAVTIDHTSFPHIIDAIINSSCPSALKALRATSRWFRERVDSKQLRHVFLDAQSCRHLSIVRVTVEGAVGGHLPCVKTMLIGKRVIVDDGSGDWQQTSCDVDPHTSLRTGRILGLMNKHTQIVDLMQHPYREIHCLPLASVDVLRIRRAGPPSTSYSSFPWNPKTIIVFPHYHGRRTIWAPQGSYDEGDKCDVHLSTSTRKLVLNTSGQTSSILDDWSLRIPRGQSVHLVVIFPYYRSRTELSARRGSFPFWSPRYGRLGYSVGELAYNSFPDCKMTLVGLDEVSAQFEARFTDLLRDGIKDVMDDDELSNPTKAEAKVTAILANITFMSMNDYAKTVADEERLALEVLETKFVE